MSTDALERAELERRETVETLDELKGENPAIDESLADQVEEVEVATEAGATEAAAQALAAESAATGTGANKAAACTATAESAARTSTNKSPARTPATEGTAARKLATEAAAAEATEGDLGTFSASTGLISVCVLISRITGFARTWAMAFALGATFLSSSYQIANNLPTMLYDLVMGGMLTTAFLPVYLSIIRNEDAKRSNDYASNLLTLVTIVLGIFAAIGIFWPQIVIFTQTFYSDQAIMGTATMLFQFFAIQTIFYGGSTVISGLLNAHRDYFWSSAAPIANNVIVIATFLLYAAIAPNNPDTALYIIAIGNPLGVFVQMAFQIPALAKNGIRLRPRLNLRDPAIRETIAIGLPALLVTICSFVTVSVMNAASYAFKDNGPAVIAYARLWYTLPYSFLSVPITTAMFTELADLHAKGDKDSMVSAICWGSCQTMFLLLPFCLYLIFFSYPLVSLYHIGAFTAENIGVIASFLGALAVALPFYGISSFQMKAFSSIRKMGTFSVMNVIASVVQVAATAGAVALYQQGAPISIDSIAYLSALYFIICDGLGFWYLHRYFGRIGFGKIVVSSLKGLGLGLLGALCGYGLLKLLELGFGVLNGDFLQALVYVVICGVVAVVITFGIALGANMPEAALIRSLWNKVFGRFLRL